MWFDLTNTDRFYNSAEVEQNDCRYLKIQCQGHGATPTLQQTRVFLDIAESYISKFPLAKIGKYQKFFFIILWNSSDETSNYNSSS